MKISDYLTVSVVWHHFAGKKNFDVKVKAVSTQNKLGKLDILPGHANFISVIFNNLVFLDEGNKPTTIAFDRGIVEVRENLVRFYLETRLTSDARQQVA